MTFMITLVVTFNYCLFQFFLFVRFLGPTERRRSFEIDAIFHTAFKNTSNAGIYSLPIRIFANCAVFLFFPLVTYRAMRFIISIYDVVIFSACSMFPSVSFTGHSFFRTSIKLWHPIRLRSFGVTSESMPNAFLFLPKTNNFSSAHAHTIHDMLHTLPYFMSVFFWCVSLPSCYLSHTQSMFVSRITTK